MRSRCLSMLPNISQLSLNVRAAPPQPGAPPAPTNAKAAASADDQRLEDDTLEMVLEKALVLVDDNMECVKITGLSQSTVAFWVRRLELRTNLDWSEVQGPLHLYPPFNQESDISLLRAWCARVGKWNVRRWTPAMKRHRPSIYLAIERNPRNFLHTDAPLSNDVELATKAVMSRPSLLFFLNAFHNNKSVVLAAVSVAKSNVLQHASVELRDDADVATAAVTRKGSSLSSVSTRLRASFEIAKLAVGQNGMALQFASAELKGNRSLVEQAVRGDGMAIRYASDDLRTDRAIVTTALSTNGLAASFLPAVHGDVEMAAIALAQNGLALQFFDDAIKANKTLVLVAVKQNPDALGYASAEIRDNEEVTLVAMRKDLRVRRFASSRVQQLPRVLHAADGFKYPIKM